MEYKDNYLEILTSEHRDKPKFRATVSALLDPLQDVFKAAALIPAAYHIDHAVGSQLDAIGERIGADRTVSISNTEAITLSDTEYRIYIRSVIAANHWQGGIEDLQETWKYIFGSHVIIQDNMDMSINVKLIGPKTSSILKLIKAGVIVPKPVSVGVNIEYVSGGKLFGYGEENELITGYGGYWQLEESESVFAYDTDAPTEGRAGYNTGIWSDTV